MRTRPPCRTSTVSPSRSVGDMDGPDTRTRCQGRIVRGTVPMVPRPTHPSGVGSSQVSTVEHQKGTAMRLFRPTITAYAHCDLPCGVYDPAQARIEAESVKAIQEKYQANDDPHFQARATVIKEQRAELAKHHVSVLWSDYFKPPHFEKYPELHQLGTDAL